VDHAAFERRLRAAYNAEAPKRRQIKLPTPASIRVSGDLAHATLHLSRSAVLANMQDEAAAFDGWALALMAWCGTERVSVDWDEPDADALAADPGHYQRFLYRARRFADLLGPERVEICQGHRLDRLRVGPGKRAILNVASQCRIAPYGNAAPDWRMLGENQLECWLTAPDSPAQQRLLAALRLQKLDRQFPVGVFAGSVARANRVFTGGKSAIDILGIDDSRTLWLFELKARTNLRVGALSELFFYSAVIHDVLTDREHWGFHAPASTLGAHIGPEDVLTCERIVACLMAPPLHPLLDPATGPGRRIFDLLNDSAARLGWNISFGTLDLRQFLDAEATAPSIAAPSPHFSPAAGLTG
jgi:hypothetical protein